MIQKILEKNLFIGTTGDPYNDEVIHGIPETVKEIEEMKCINCKHGSPENGDGYIFVKAKCFKHDFFFPVGPMYKRLKCNDWEAKNND